jgi:hypothetical protein
MAIVAFDPLSAAAGYLKRPIDSHGKLRYIYGKVVAATLGDIGSTINMGKLPPGAVRFLYPPAWILVSAWGAARTLSIGHSAYRSKQDQAALNDGIEPASVNALASALDVSAAARIALSATLLKYDFYSLAGVDIVATVAGGTFPAAGTIEWLIPYLYE